jgi:hypothetical protein
MNIDELLKDRKMFWLLDDAGEAVPAADIHDFMAWLVAHPESRHVGDTTTAGVRVSTIFLGLNTAVFGRPLMFETMVFGATPDGESRPMYRWGSRSEALAGHQQMVQAVDLLHARGDAITGAALDAIVSPDSASLADTLAAILSRPDLPPEDRERVQRLAALLDEPPVPQRPELPTSE